MLLLWYSCAFPLTSSIEKSFKKLLISYGFLLAFLLFSCGVDVALLCFPIAFLRFSPAFSIEKSIKNCPFWGAWRSYFGYFWCPGGFLGPSWCQSRSGERLGVDFGWILASIWEPLGLLFSIFLDANFKSKKGQLPNQFFVECWFNFGSCFGYVFDIFLTMLESCDLN